MVELILAVIGGIAITAIVGYLVIGFIVLMRWPG